MRHLVTAFVMAAIMLAFPPNAQSRQNHFRVGGSFVSPTSSSTRDIFGNGWALSGEYSMTDLLTPDEMLGGGDVSLAVTYRSFDHDLGGVNYNTQYTSFGMRWRGGAGARPDSEGFYGGVGVAAALFSVRSAAGPVSEREGVVKFEYSAFAGANFARQVYTEIAYCSVPGVSGLSFSNAMVTVGVRF